MKILRPLILVPSCVILVSCASLQIHAVHANHFPRKSRTFPLPLQLSDSMCGHQSITSTLVLLIPRGGARSSSVLSKRRIRKALKSTRRNLRKHEQAIKFVVLPFFIGTILIAASSVLLSPGDGSHFSYLGNRRLRRALQYTRRFLRKNQGVANFLIWNLVLSTIIMKSMIEFGAFWFLKCAFFVVFGMWQAAKIFEIDYALDFMSRFFLRSTNWKELVDAKQASVLLAGLSHMSLKHLLSNLSSLMALADLEEKIGSRKVAYIFLGGTLFGAIASCLWYKGSSNNLGASDGIMALLSSNLLILGPSHEVKLPGSGTSVNTVVYLCFLLASEALGLLGNDSGGLDRTNYAAHLGGATFGVLFHLLEQATKRTYGPKEKYPR
jgi:membrane associated rhomboid family serine protease